MIVFGHTSLKHQETLNCGQARISSREPIGEFPIKVFQRFDSFIWKFVTGHFIAISLCTKTGEAYIFDSLNSTQGAYKSRYYSVDTLELLCSSILFVVNMSKNRRQPSLYMRKSSLTRVQSGLDCGPTSLFYAEALSQFNAIDVGKLQYQDAHIQSLREIHSAILRDRKWARHILFKLVLTSCTHINFRSVEYKKDTTENQFQMPSIPARADLSEKRKEIHAAPKKKLSRRKNTKE